MSYQQLDDRSDGEYRQYYSAAAPSIQQPQGAPNQQAAGQYYQPHPNPYVPQQQQQQQPPGYGNNNVPSSSVYQSASAPLVGQQQPSQPVYYAQPVVLQQGHPGIPGHVIRGIWSDGVFDCFDSGFICLLSFFLPCIRWGMTISRAKYLTLPVAILLYALPAITYQALYTYLSVQYPSTYGTDPVINYDAPYIICLVFMLVCHVATVVIGAYYRNKLRTDYRIAGNACEDCAWHLCCACCAIAQEARHVDRDYAIPV